ncbi:probable sodium/potassium-transporting ATPase subunit beta-3 [Lineus longissimus]|uniref:probable sodium/potassium-transporting ATPase subunit beta-3 n=1 Tax=Lineus longissimus TaxID=88925 RepID=UPI002B4DDFB5
MACIVLVRISVLLGLCLEVLSFGNGIRRDIPGLMFWPRPNVHNIRDSTLEITVDDPSTYRDHVWRLESYLKAEYVTRRLDDTNNVYDCSPFSLRPETMPQEAVCRFDIASLGPCNAQENYGYSSGEPCVILRLGRLLGWKPRNYSRIKITCSGREPIDRSNMGKVYYYPSQVVDSKYFPFLNQANYMLPSVAVKFKGLTRGTLVKLACSATDSSGEVGNITFEILMR